MWLQEPDPDNAGVGNKEIKPMSKVLDNLETIDSSYIKTFQVHTKFTFKAQEKIFKCL